MNAYVKIHTLQKSITGAYGKYHFVEISFRIISGVVKIFSVSDIFRKIITNYLGIISKCPVDTTLLLFVLFLKWSL